MKKRYILILILMIITLSFSKVNALTLTSDDPQTELDDIFNSFDFTDVKILRSEYKENDNLRFLIESKLYARWVNSNYSLSSMDIILTCEENTCEVYLDVKSTKDNKYYQTTTREIGYSLYGATFKNKYIVMNVGDTVTLEYDNPDNDNLLFDTTETVGTNSVILVNNKVTAVEPGIMKVNVRKYGTFEATYDTLYVYVEPERYLQESFKKYEKEIKLYSQIYDGYDSLTNVIQNELDSKYQFPSEYQIYEITKSDINCNDSKMICDINYEIEYNNKKYTLNTKGIPVNTKKDLARFNYDSTQLTDYYIGKEVAINYYIYENGKSIKPADYSKNILTSLSPNLLEVIDSTHVKVKKSGVAVLKISISNYTDYFYVYIGTNPTHNPADDPVIVIDDSKKEGLIYDEETKKWTYYQNGNPDYTYNGVAKNEKGTWYVNNGIVTFKHNELVQYKGKWTAFVKSKMTPNYTGVLSNSKGAWYIKDGTVQFNFNGTYKDSTGDIYIIKAGKVDTTQTTVEKVDGTWYYFNKGKTDLTYTGVAKNSKGTWYVNEGIVTFKHNELIQYKGKWTAFVKSKMTSNYTGLLSNSKGNWYLENGVVMFKYNGTYKDPSTGKTYQIKNGKVV